MHVVSVAKQQRHPPFLLRLTMVTVALSFAPKTAFVGAFKETLNFSLPSCVESLMMSAAQVTPDIPELRTLKLRMLGDFVSLCQLPIHNRRGQQIVCC